MSVDRHDATAASGRDELPAERRRLEYARECLERNRAEMIRLAEEASRRGGDEELVAWLFRRARQLEDREKSPLFFGRLDGPEPEPVYIGRRYVSDEGGTPVVIDWRTDMAARFYRATAADPMEVTRRRRYGFASDHELTGFDDELLDELDDGVGLSAFVRREIEQAHFGPMRDIVATIQPDQDHIVRRGADTCLVVQGGPGTGKTAVGLHRAAFLLFEHKRVREQGVLVVAPNDTFVRYISRVLPALGEIDSTHLTLAGLVGADKAVAEHPDVAAVKGDIRMATVLRRAVRESVRLPDEDFVVKQTSPYIRLYPGEIEELAADLIADRRPFAVARDLMRDRVAGRVRRTLETRGGTLTDAEAGKLSRTKQVRALVEGIWPKLKPRDMLFGLLSDADALAVAAEGVLTREEQELIRWATPPATAARAKWSAADFFLLDELAAQLAIERRFGHVVLDEAQDLSAMQLRAVARRCAGSATLLGDLAQQTTRWALPTWEDVLGVLDLPGELVTLQVSYRVPKQILDLANHLLTTIAPDLPATVSARSAEWSVEVRPLVDSLADEVVAIVDGTDPDDGTIGVIVADPDLETVRSGLTAAGVALVDADEVDRERRVALVPVGAAKGLEFDHVVLVDPRRVLDMGPAGHRLLYIALTRAVSRLSVIGDAEVLGIAA